MRPAPVPGEGTMVSVTELEVRSGPEWSVGVEVEVEVGGACVVVVVVVVGGVPREET